jgi:glycosyltransferase involved in cell wall biosynthesis
LNYKVSVVVPIYKVEKYLSRCLESILAQTYKNLEIVLVDDGSPDKCGYIAKSYANSDNRITVLQKENGGLSDARNYGIKYVTGDYTLFVDSDDWLDPKMIENMVRVSEKFEADVVQSAFYYAYDDYLLFDSRVFVIEAPPIVYDNKLVMTQLVINEKVKNFAWGKLYKTVIIKDIPFKKGVLFEDVFWAHKVMQRVNKFVSINEPLYYYYQRGDSIVSTYTPRHLDIIKGLKERHQFIEEHYKDLIDESYKMLLKTNLIHYNLLFKIRDKDRKGQHRKEIQRYIINNYSKLKNSVRDEKIIKMQLILFRLHPYLNVLYIFFIRIFRKINIFRRTVGLERLDL